MKHIKILSFLIITILFSSCEERVHLDQFDQFPENVYRLNRLDQNYGDDPLLYNGRVFSGVVFDSYGSGEVVWEVFFKDGFKQKLITYYKDGKVRLKMNFVNNNRNGISEEYYDNGQLQEKITFVDGKYIGPYEKYDKNGQLRIKGTQKGYDKWDGLFEKYYENGQLNKKYIKKNGEFDGPHEEYYENGQLKEKYTYKDGDWDGPYEIYFENGQLKEKGSYKEDKLDGLYEEYYENGQLKEKYTYKDGDFDGLYEEYYENGQLKEKYTYKDGDYDDGPYEVVDHEYGRVFKGIIKNGKFNGTTMGYSDKGELLEKFTIENSKKNGICEYYKDGKLYRTGMFENDRLVGDYEYNLINVDIPETDNNTSKSEEENSNSNNKIQSVPGKYPQSSTTQLKPNELTEMSLEELQVMRNEIFGRHGFKFKEGGKMNEYFSKQNWYKPQFSNVDSKLTPIEKSNIELISSEENKRN